MSKDNNKWYGVWSVDSWNRDRDEVTYVFLLVKAKSKEDAEGIAEGRLMRRNWMTDPVATAHLATQEDFDRWKRQDLISIEH